MKHIIFSTVNGDQKKKFLYDNFLTGGFIHHINMQKNNNTTYE